LDTDQIAMPRWMCPVEPLPSEHPYWAATPRSLCYPPYPAAETRAITAAQAVVETSAAAKPKAFFVIWWNRAKGY